MKSVSYSAFSDHQLNLRVWRGVVLSGVLLFVFFLALSHFALSSPGVADDFNKYTRTKDLLGLGQIIGLVTAGIATPFFVNARIGRHERIFARLLADNRWKELHTFHPEALASILRGNGDFNALYAFGGTNHGRHFTCAIFEFVTHLDERSPVRRMTCLNIHLPKAFPLIVLDNKQNDLDHGLRSNLPERIPGGVILSLEGDFNDYYHASTTKNSERVATEVMSPDLMAVIADMASSKIDIEINGHNLFLMHENDFYTKQSLKDIFALADAITDKLEGLSKTWMSSSAAEAHAVERTARKASDKLILKPFHAWPVVVLVLLLVITPIAALVHVLVSNDTSQQTNKISVKNPVQQPDFTSSKYGFSIYFPGSRPTMSDFTMDMGPGQDPLPYTVFKSSLDNNHQTFAVTAYDWPGTDTDFESMSQLDIKTSVNNFVDEVLQNNKATLVSKKELKSLPYGRYAEEAEFTMPDQGTTITGYVRVFTIGNFEYDIIAEQTAEGSFEDFANSFKAIDELVTAPSDGTYTNP